MSNEKKQEIGKAFVRYVIERMDKNKGVAAKLRHADNPATEYQCWEILAGFNVKLDDPNRRLPFATIAAAMAKAKIIENGTARLGEVLAGCYEKGKESDQAKAKLRRLLAADSLEEVCRILRPVFSLIQSKNSKKLDFARLLEDLLNYNYNHLRIKSQWAQSFYGTSIPGEKEE